ncbi:MAG: threonine synthase [Balneolaceae bacterium]|nr:threonine synthase [Balneolaceae bacterium]
MKFYSTKGQVEPVNFQETIFRGLPADNGLFMPEMIPTLPSSFFDELPQMTLPEIGFEVLRHFVDGEIPDDELKTIVEETLSFDIPLAKINDSVYALELFHGPTMAFKDVGARFLARCLSYFTKKNHRKLTVLVATSGDTGSAVANGFFNVDDIEVVILYPSGKVSGFQEQQMTTLGGNITALEVDGTFDDCQALVKQAFLDDNLREAKQLTSANSINIARLLPQSIYYFYAWAQLPADLKTEAVFSVPSGNYGNLSAGLIAQKMGLPIKHFLACSNSNDTVPMYLWNGKFEPKPSVATISNAMDVGNPSNFFRMLDLFDGSYKKMINQVTGYAYTDDTTRDAIRKTYALYGYILDPHGAVGYLGLMDYFRSQTATGIVLETAHPIKFKQTVEEQILRDVPVPDHVQVTHLEKKSIPFKADIDAFRTFLKEK